ncbi:MAG: hypothetical protein NVS2B11_17100 [Acetobacteraceae bacterium]
MPASHNANAAPSGPAPIARIASHASRSGITLGSNTRCASPASTAVPAQNPATAATGTELSRFDRTEYNAQTSALAAANA